MDNTGEFWVIRHKRFGELMPARLGRQARGWSFWTPLPFYSAQRLAQAPRLFETERGARNALTCWLQGEWVTQHRYGSWEEGYPEEAGGPAPGEPQVPRRREEVEIVQVQLTVRA